MDTFENRVNVAGTDKGEEMEKTIEVKNLNYDTTYDVYLEVYDVAGNAVRFHGG